MAIETNKLQLGNDGVYSGNCYVGVSADGLNVQLKDPTVGEKTLAEILGSVATHNIGDHGNMTSDFAEQYYNASRLAAYIADAVKGVTVGISGDVGGSSTLGQHVADAAIHQRVPKFVLRVAKGGQSYSTITAALAAVPTSGADAPAPDQWWRIEVSPGVYEEAVLLDKQWVEICGAGAETTRIEFDNAAAPTTYALEIAVDNTIVRRLGVRSTNPTVADNPALVVNGGLSTALYECNVYTPGGLAAMLYDGTYYDCRFQSVSGRSVHVEGSEIRFRNCDFKSETGFPLADVYCKSCSQTFFYSCQSYGSLLEVRSCSSITVRDCYSQQSGVKVAIAAASNGTSNVYWDSIGYDDGVGVSTDIGTLNVYRVNDGDVFTRRDVTMDWRMHLSEPEQRTLTAGNYGMVLSGDPAEFGGSVSDFHFYRAVAFNTADLVGDLFAIGDTSTTAIGANTANALALYLGAGNASGKFFRWIDGEDVGGTELGYIDRDGKMRAPGVHADEYKSADGSAGLTRDVVAYDTDGTTPVTLTFKNGLLAAVV